MSDFEVIARLKIRAGQLQGFKAQANEIIRLAREKDTKTVRYDWFIDEDGLECEVHEVYVNEQGLIEHNQHVMDARAVLFDKYAYDHRMSTYEEISEQLRELGKKHAGGFSEFSLLQSLEAPAAV